MTSSVVKLHDRCWNNTGGVPSILQKIERINYILDARFTFPEVNRV